LLEENRETEIGRLDRRVVALVQEKEVLGLEVTMDDPEGMASLNNADHGAANASSFAFSELPFGDDPIEELPTSTQFHHQMNAIPILVSAFELDDVGVTSEMVHDLNLAAYIFDIFLVGELALGYGLTSEELPGDLIGAEAGDAELPTSELPPERVCAPDIFHGPIQHIPDVRSRPWAR
jgi:hypothetical protein